MRRLGRILLGGLTALSLLLCAASVALWVRSRDRTESVSWRGGGPMYVTWHEVRSDPRGLRLKVRRAEFHQEEDWLRSRAWRDVAAVDETVFGFTYGSGLPRQGSDWLDENLRDPVKTRHRWGGFGYLTTDLFWPSKLRRRGVIVVAPHWSAVAATAALPGARLLSVIRRRRRARASARAGRCPACGYDLRATPDKCPECGAVPAAATAEAAAPAETNAGL